MTFPTKKLGEVCSLHKEPGFNIELPYVGLEDLESGTGKLLGSRLPRRVKSTTFYFNEGDVLYGRLRPYLNKVLLPNFKGHCSTEIFPIKVSKTLNKKFLFYWITSDGIVKLINRTSTGTRMPRANMKEVLNFEIPLPSLPEQKRIVKILDEMFENIERAKENTEKNLRNAKALFEASLNKVFKDRGEGWEERRLGEIADMEYGFTAKAQPKGDFRYIRITDIDEDGNLASENKLFIKQTKESESLILSDGDLLVARTGASYGDVLFYRDVEPSVFASYLIRIKFRELVANKLYWYFSKSKPYWNQARKLSSGSAQPQFNGGALKQIVFAYPRSQSAQRALVRNFDSLFLKTKKLEELYRKKLSDLDELKKSLLKKAFSGEL